MFHCQLQSLFEISRSAFWPSTTEPSCHIVVAFIVHKLYRVDFISGIGMLLFRERPLFELTLFCANTFIERNMWNSLFIKCLIVITGYTTSNGISRYAHIFKGGIVWERFPVDMPIVEKRLRKRVQACDIFLTLNICHISFDIVVI